jgi:hypothetical protein
MTTKEAVIQQLLLSNGFANKHIFTVKIENSNRGTVFSVRSVPRCYKQDSDVKTVWVELVESCYSWGRGHFGNPEQGNRPQLEAVIKQPLGKTEKALMCAGACSSVRLSWLFVVTFCKCSINPITNPNPVYSHSKIVEIYIDWVFVKI